MSGLPQPSTPDARIAGVREILAREGIEGDVSVAGHAADVAALAVAPEHLARLAELAPEVKALGFRYVAIELREGAAGA